jgi:multiple sugar transport system substrate-binding protein
MKTSGSMMNRRGFIGIALGIAGAVALSACGSDPGASPRDGTPTAAAGQLQMAWWGNAVRDENTANIIKAYGDVAPGVKISPQSTDFAGYWDRLATQAAANDIPDVVQMDVAYIREYAERGALLDLSEYGLDVSEFGPGTVDSGRVDGALVGANAGVNTPMILANPAVFEAAGVPMPDDTTWTWDDFAAVAAAVTAGSPAGTYGSSSPNAIDGGFHAFLRQRDKALFDSDGLAFNASDLAEWYEWTLELGKAGAIPPPSAIAEEAAKTQEQEMFAVGKAAMTWVHSNSVPAYEAATGQTLKLLRFPSTTGHAKDAKMWYKASMLWSASAGASDPEAAAAFIDFMVNSPESGRIGLTERGVPANLEVRDTILPTLKPADVRTVEFIEAIESELGPAPVNPPPGGGIVQEILGRFGETVAFEQATPEQAAESLITELSANIGG